MVCLALQDLSMAGVLEIQDYWITVSDQCTTCNFKALVEDAVQVLAATRYEPAEFGAATCVGSVDLGDDELPPGEDNEEAQLALADSVDNWEVPEPDDFDMMSSFGTKWHDRL
jgi:hypothetical protein